MNSGPTDAAAKTKAIPGNEPSPPLRRHRLRPLALALVWTVLTVLSLWAVAALDFDVRISWLRLPLAVVYGIAVAGVLILVKPRRLAAIICAAGFLVVLGWWFTLAPSNTRDWQPDLAVLPYADINGNQITVHNIRNCDYRTETDFDVRHYDRTFDLDKLQSADLFLSY